MIIKTKSLKLAANVKGNKNSKKLALVLPGRLDTKDYECFNSHLEFLASKGFLALSFDPPGTWESPGGIELFTTTNYIKAVNELIELHGNKPTLLLGHSRGGAVAAIDGSKNPAVIEIVTIAESFGTPSPPSKEELKSGIHMSYRDFPPGTQKTTKQKSFKLPLSYFEDGEKYNDAESLKTCRKPKLIFYAKDDEFNSPKEVKRIFDSLPQPKELHELDCNHDYRYNPKMVEKVNEILGRFLEKYQG